MGRIVIPFFNVREQYFDCQRETDHYMQHVMSTGQMYSGEYIDHLKEIISSYYDNAGVCLTNSGTSALVTALMALNIEQGTGILIPTLTYAATAQAILAIGCYPVFVDIDEHFLMCMRDMDAKFERFRPNVGAVIAVDLYGQGMDLNELVPWCEKNRLPLIIDAAQSWSLSSTSYDQTRADAVCLSFNPLKNWGGTGGGAVVSNRINMDMLRAITHEGKLNGSVVQTGTNMRMDSIQAAVLVAKYDYCRMNGLKKRMIHFKYSQNFRHMMPLTTEWKSSIPYVSVIAPKDAAAVRAALDTVGIEHRSHYDLPLHMEPAFERYSLPCPRAEYLAGRLISLPNHWHLRDDQVDTVIATVLSAI
jgi:UDP-2-acetamido-2-deoxy-ribo-hexuluronate aminotransferase